MSDRLAEIEATRKKILSEYEFSRADDDMLMLLTSGIPWLLARVRELEAQAAREAETATLSEPLMEYGEVHVQRMWELNGLASEGWRVVAATYIPPQVGTSRQGWNCLLGKPRN